MACCMIAPGDDGDWEIMKFASKETVRANLVFEMYL